MGRQLPVDRFMQKVAISDECWLWTASTMGNGYGQFNLYGKKVYAHRASYQFFIGPVDDGLKVRHTCDTPRCVRPDHLKLGTQKENVADMLERGRAWVWTKPERLARGDRNGMRTQPHRRPCVTGVRNGQARLNPEQVEQIRSRYTAGGITQAALAREYGVHPTAVFKIIHRLRWKESDARDGARGCYVLVARCHDEDSCRARGGMRA